MRARNPLCEPGALKAGFIGSSDISPAEIDLEFVNSRLEMSRHGIAVTEKTRIIFLLREGTSTVNPTMFFAFAMRMRY
jgi:hypothetical protein